MTLRAILSAFKLLACALLLVLLAWDTFDSLRSALGYPRQAPLLVRAVGALAMISLLVYAIGTAWRSL